MQISKVKLISVPNLAFNHEPSELIIGWKDKKPDIISKLLLKKKRCIINFTPWSKTNRINKNMIIFFIL